MDAFDWLDAQGTKEAHAVRDELAALRNVLSELLALPEAEKQLGYLRNGIGTETANAAWLRAARMLRFA